MKALVLVQSPRVDTYINVFAAICHKYKKVKQIRLLYITEDKNSVTKKEIRERLVELSKEYALYEGAADVFKDTDDCSFEKLGVYTKQWDIVDVSGLSKETSISIAAMSVSNRNVRVCSVHWLKQFKKGDAWVLSDSNHEYINLLSTGALALLRNDHFQKRHVIIAFGGIFGSLTLLVLFKIMFPTFFIPNIVVNVFGLLIGVAGLYLAAVSLSNGVK